MRHRRIWMCITVCILAVGIFFILTEPVLADVGNSFSGGGHSSGGSFGGGSHYRGGGYSSGGGFGGIFLLGNSPMLLIVVALVILYSIMSARKKTQGESVGNYANPGIRSNEGIHEEAVLARIREEDPAFSGENFKMYANEVWLTLQEAWEAKDWHKVRPFESNTLFNVHNRQLQEYIDHHKTNFMNMQNIRETTIASYHSDEEHEIIRVKLDASLLDYVVDDESGKVIEGSKTEYVYRSYHLEFIRKKGVKTIEKEGTAVTNCPNCGAPTNVTSSGQCEYCKSVITKGDYGWVLNAYKPW